MSVGTDDPSRTAGGRGPGPRRVPVGDAGAGAAAVTVTGGVVGWRSAPWDGSASATELVERVEPARRPEPLEVRDEVPGHRRIRLRAAG